MQRKDTVKNPALKETLLSNTDRDLEAGQNPSELDAFETILKNNPWLAELAENAPLPSRYRFSSHHTLALLFSSAVVVSASFLFMDGSKHAGPKYVIGGVGVNAEQNAMFAVATYYFFLNFFRDPRASIGVVSLSMLVAGVATMPSVVSEYEESKGDMTRVALTAFGSYPGNVFGISNALDRIKNARHDDPYMRDFLRQEFKKALTDYVKLQDALEPERWFTTSLLRGVVGIGLSGVMVGSLMGYACQSTKFNIHTLSVPRVPAIMLGLLENLPTAAMAVACAGLDLTKDIIHGLADFITCRIHPSKRDVKYAMIFLLPMAATILLSQYSSATSLDLFDKACPADQFGPDFTRIARFNVDHGTKHFNAILSNIAVYNMLNYFKHAYAEGKDKAKYSVQKMDAWLRLAPIKKVDALAKRHFVAFRTDAPPAEAKTYSQALEMSDIKRKSTSASKKPETEKQASRSRCVIM